MKTWGINLLRTFWLQKEMRWLTLILGVGAFMRVYRIEDFYQFAHDQDLYAWIVKDMWIDGNFRLIGQLTSFDGVYIGPYFYYLLVPFFVLGKMHPLSATVPITIIGLLTVWSFYWVFAQIAGKRVGLTAAAIYAVSLENVFFDRWVVPTQPTIIWAIWYMWGSYLILKGKMRGWIWIGGLFGLIWHIHIALLPLVPVSLALLVFRRCRPGLRTLGLSLGIFFLISGPFWVFELRHGFVQTQSFLSGSGGTSDYPTGWPRFIWILERIGFALRGNLFSYSRWSGFWNLVPVTVMSGFAFYRKLVDRGWLFFSGWWIGLVLLAQMLSPKGVSEYYFANLTPVVLLLLSVSLVEIFRGKEKLLVLVLTLFAVWNIVKFTQMPSAGDWYKAKIAVVDAIVADAKQHGYPCVSLTYIAQPGMNVGFRYLFWWRDMPLVEPGRGAQIYNVFIGIRPGDDEIFFKAGDIQVGLAQRIGEVNSEVCSKPENQLQPLLGFVR